MTREEFIQVLDDKGYSYEIEEDKLIVNERWMVYLNSLKEIPPGVWFENIGYVNLESLEELHPGVVFQNGGYVNLNSLKKISPGVVFQNGDYVYLESLIGGKFGDWRGNIEGITSNRLLNVMIKRGVFI